MIITIGGLAGTGTTTTAELLSEKLDIPYISAGFVFREMAAERGMSVLEFSEFAEGNYHYFLASFLKILRAQLEHK